ncbi:MAG TPA: dihydroorotase family protein [Candidatus Bathyarchaeia archaeon]
MTVDLVLNHAKAYMDKKIVACSIAVNNGKIHKIGKEANMPKAEKETSLENLLVLPGLIDAHVHLRDEGKTYKEDFNSGTAAAAAGGVTTVLDMPNNNPLTMSADTIKNRMRLAETKILVNVGFYSAFPENLKEMQAITAEGSVAFKLFMAEQIGGLNIDDDEALLKAFKAAGEFGVPVAVHAEDKTLLKKAEERLKHANRNDVDAFLEAHSENVEANAVERLLKIVKQTNVHIHFCHISTEKGLKAIVDGKKSEMKTTCEVTPHHLLLSDEDLKKKGSLALTMPPLRANSHAEALWKGIQTGWVDTIGSDHAPHTLEEKKAKSVWDVKVGISGLETMLPLMLTMVNRGMLSIGDVARLMAEKPAEIFNLKGRGSLKEGNNADLIVVDLKRRCKIDAANFYSKAKFSPFDGWQVKGKPVKTFVNGELIMDDGEIVAEAGSGQVIRRAKS